MEKIKVILIGAGDRGTNYVMLAKEHCLPFELVGVADPDPIRRNYIRDQFSLPESACYHTWEEILAAPKVADAAIIATQDQMHYAPAMCAIEQGYHLLLEKPAAPTPEECYRIAVAANEKGVHVIVCHVLRFTPFFRLLKQLIDEDRVGKIMNIDHVECVGNVHYSHSYVRGNWRNSETSTPMILAKSCHDIDILQWLLGKRCEKLQSFGSLSYFTAKNKPSGAPEYCVQGCPVEETCPYNAKTVYLKLRKHVGTATGKHDPTDADILDTITNTGYGKCVFGCDNNVVDHQTVNLCYRDGATATFTMSAFNRGGRKIRIMGTKGEIYAEMSSDHVTLFDFETRETKEIPISNAVRDESKKGGHGGGDLGIMRDFLALLLGTYKGNTIADITTSVENHLVTFAAEAARRSGQVLDMDEYVKSFH